MIDGTARDLSSNMHYALLSFTLRIRSNLLSQTVFDLVWTCHIVSIGRVCG